MKATYCFWANINREELQGIFFRWPTSCQHFRITKWTTWLLGLACTYWPTGSAKPFWSCRRHCPASALAPCSGSWLASPGRNWWWCRCVTGIHCQSECRHSPSAPVACWSRFESPPNRWHPCASHGCSEWTDYVPAPIECRRSVRRWCIACRAQCLPGPAGRSWCAAAAMPALGQSTYSRSPSRWVRLRRCHAWAIRGPKRMRPVCLRARAKIPGLVPVIEFTCHNSARFGSRLATFFNIQPKLLQLGEQRLQRVDVELRCPITELGPNWMVFGWPNAVDGPDILLRWQRAFIFNILIQPLHAASDGPALSEN